MALHFKICSHETQTQYWQSLLLVFIKKWNHKYGEISDYFHDGARNVAILANRHVNRHVGFQYLCEKYEFDVINLTIILILAFLLGEIYNCQDEKKVLPFAMKITRK